VNELATAQVLTENAPPAGFREPLAFPAIDQGLEELSGWRYLVQMEFEGAFARTSRPAQVSTSAEVWFNQIASSRRVVFETSGSLTDDEEGSTYEAVRMGPDAFLVRENTCLSNAGESAETAADLSAGTLIGGVFRAVSAARMAVINGQQAWHYDFTTADLNLPNIVLADGGQVTATGGELWVAPEHGVAVRFYINLDVENARVFGNQLPVTGQVIMRYDLFDIGIVPNISVPFGC
jgi:hypothetical protein